MGSGPLNGADFINEPGDLVEHGGEHHTLFTWPLLEGRQQRSPPVRQMEHTCFCERGDLTGEGEEHVSGMT